MIDILRNLLYRFGDKNESISKTSENDCSEQTFETPDIDEFLTENQTADEL